MPLRGGALCRLIASQAGRLVAVIRRGLIVIRLGRTACVAVVAALIVVVEVGMRVTGEAMPATVGHRRRAVGGDGQRSGQRKRRGQQPSQEDSKSGH